jgi:predicted O-methyltransferase YrrM
MDIVDLLAKMDEHLTQMDARAEAAAARHEALLAKMDERLARQDQILAQQAATLTHLVGLTYIAAFSVMALIGFRGLTPYGRYVSA